ncbi:hypothetical protein [Planktothrix paucivesiculata]|uniref:Uncharacterized protein n=1 Tax=Planktothrix paucivesiculata PCC 9631 TaxID=671071 RepID=A0A7Z9E2K9_9CYAN|nr:hypothetical protein [Planktothrix paucivesiculata]VXD22647.1 conserved hypothetical protein [Planktothrix paucivesiculata PCC 9631]
MMSSQSQQQQTSLPSSVNRAEMTRMAVQWAQKYYAKAAAHSPRTSNHFFLENHEVDVTEFDEDRSRTVAELTKNLSLLGTLAWNKVGTLLGIEWNRYPVNKLRLEETDTLIQDVSNLYHQALEVFAQYEYPFRLSVSLGREAVKLRRKYSETEPLMLVLVQLQFHYMGRMLLEWMSMKERTVFFLYFKTLEDYLYSPLGEVNDLAGKHLSDSPALIAVQQLLPIFTTIANQVYHKVHDLNPGYCSVSGNVKNHILQYSTTRDIELFEIYLCWCVLENSLRPIQRELFPMCVILYPRLHISWKLIQDMLDAMSEALENRLLPQNFAVFSPYLHVLAEIFSDQVVQTV